MIEEMKAMKKQLINCAMAHMNDLKTVDTHQLGQVIDMIKDLSEAIYYCTTAKAMEQQTWEDNKHETNDMKEPKKL